MSRSVLLLLMFVAAALAGGAYLLGDSEGEAISASLSVAGAMTGDTVGYARAMAPHTFSFPEDHGPHPDFKTEWWYYTGNLDAEGGRHFGYELTIFRIALTPAAALVPRRTSGWATNQLYMAHFALSDVENEAFHVFERFSRGAAGLAGAQAAPFRVWLEDWSAEQVGEGMPPIRVRASEGGVAVDLTLEAAKPLVLQGDDGLDQKGQGAGNASYYYSMTRLTTAGTVTVGGQAFAVAGLSWMDREWSTSALGEDQVGWDWFAFHLSDGRDLMYYQLRERDGRPGPYSNGVLVGEDGAARPLAREDVQIEVLDVWKSPHSAATYPVRWRLRIPGEALDLTATAYFPDQELDVTVRYWEGAVRFEGTAAGRPVQGSGYVEMTGYGDNDAQPV